MRRAIVMLVFCTACGTSSGAPKLVELVDEQSGRSYELAYEQMGDEARISSVTQLRDGEVQRTFNLWWVLDGVDHIAELEDGEEQGRINLAYEDDLVISASHIEDGEEKAKRAFGYRGGRLVARLYEYDREQIVTEYGYDGEGRLFTMTTDGEVTTFVHDGDQLAASTGDGRDCTYTSDGEDRLSAVSCGTASFELRYDGEGRVGEVVRKTAEKVWALRFEYGDGEMDGLVPTLAGISAETFPGAEHFDLYGRTFDNIPVATLQLLGDVDY